MTFIRARCDAALALLSGMAFAILLAMLAAFPATPALAQGFSVSPIRLEADVPPNRNISIPFVIANTTDTSNFVLNVEHVELLQNESGSWQFTDTEANFEAGRFNSNRSWFEPIQDELRIDAGKSVELVLNGRVPSDARGTYLSALLISSLPQGDETGNLRLRFQFLVPVILSIEGRPARQDIALVGQELLFERAGTERLDLGKRVSAIARIENNGETYSRLSGDMRVEFKNDKNWRLVTAIDLPERGIIPGGVLALSNTLGRSLPKGSYRLTTTLRVDGRLLPRQTVEVAFEGDPDLEGIAFDTSMTVEPSLIEISAAPGAVRAGVLSIGNPNSVPVKLEISPSIPKALEAVMMNGIQGTAYSAADWVQVAPSSFTLRPGQSRNLRVLTRLPADAPELSYFYSDLNIDASYADGQPAGTSKALIAVHNGDMPAVQDLLVERLSFASEAQPGSFVVQSRLINTGNVHVFPTGSGELRLPDGKVVRSFSIEDRKDPMVPLSVWDFAAPLDLNGVEPGTYVLNMTFLAAGNTKATRDLNVLVGRSNSGEVSFSSGEEQDMP